MAYFHLLTPVSIVANLVVVLMAFGVLGLGLLAIAAATFSNSVAGIFNSMNWVVAKGMLAVVHLFAQIPLGHVYVGAPDFDPPPCEITVLDLTEGSAIHVRTGGKDWLIDAGSGSGYEMVVCPYLRSRGVNRLEGFIATHAGTPYAGGVTSMQRDFSPQRMAGLKTGVEMRDASIDLSSVAKARVLYPAPGVKARSANDKALALLLECRTGHVLLMPGNGPEAAQWLMENEPDLRADIFVTSGRAADAPVEFIRALRVKAVICLAPEFPTTAKIDEDWAGQIEASGVRLFREDRTGAVKARLEKEGFKVNAFLGGDVYEGKF
jgi:beta-lactamase superfamily II metal-dependent hydrolase